MTIERDAEKLLGLSAVARSMLAGTETLSDTVSIKKSLQAASVDQFLLSLQWLAHAIGS